MGALSSAFCAVRPPGHHAFSASSGGFCVFNNVAIAARYAQQDLGVSRVAIVDWDVHHGNGTQEIFAEDPSVLCISLHRYEKGLFYPGRSGSPGNFGRGKGEGFSVNVGFNSIYGADDVGDAEYVHAFQQVVIPVLKEFNPGLILVSCGFDLLKGDPQGGQGASVAVCAYMTNVLKHHKAPVCVVLEGGYNLDNMKHGSEAVLKELLRGEASESKILLEERLNPLGYTTYKEMEEMAEKKASDSTRDCVKQLKKSLEGHWKSLAN